MADAVISVVLERVAAIIQEQIRNKVNLVGGVEEEVVNLSQELKIIRSVLDDAERRGFQEKSIKDWLKRLEDTSYEMEDVLDEWETAIVKFKMEHESKSAVAHKHKVCLSILSSCLCSKKVAIPHDIAEKIKCVKEQLDLILKEKDRYNFVTSQPNNVDPSRESWRVESSYIIDSSEVHGRDTDREILVSKLRPEGGSQEELSLHILAIVGVGGVGKTTLAQLVFNDDRVRKYFESVIWICVSNPFDVVGIAKGIIESVTKESCPDTNNLEMLLQYLRDSISGKKFLLVLDDVWTRDYIKWAPLKNSLKCGGAGSKILVTTRDEMVAKMMGTIDNDMCRLEQLSDKDCWLVLCRRAFLGRNKEEFKKFQDIGKKIAEKCKGSPLAAKVLGSLLCFKNSLEEWENVLNSELWQIEEANVVLFPHLLLTYNELSLALKHCFSYFAVFPKDFEIEVENLIENWMVLGYLGSNIESGGDMEIKGHEYFENLAMRSLFQVIKKSDLHGQIIRCKMYGIVHDFAQSLRMDRSNGRVQETTCLSCSSLLVSQVKKYRSLFWDKDCPPNLCDCLRRLRVLGITNCNLQSIPQGVENLIRLKWLDFSYNEFSREDLKTICKLYCLQFLRLKRCQLQEIPMEIKNLIHLRHLDLSFNKSIKELPKSICDLHELQTLNVVACSNLCGLPEEIHRLIKLKHLHNRDTSSLKQFPQGLAQLIGLCTLNVFRGGRDWSKLGWLKNLNCLHGSLTLWIRLTNDWKGVVEDAREAKLMQKIHIQNLGIIFFDYMDEKEESSVRMDVIDGLEPHPNLRNLEIWNYMGSKLPGWISSPHNQIRYIKLHGFNHMWSLPPLGKLPCLEEIYMSGMYGLQLVGREFLGLETSTAAAAATDIDIESSSSSSPTNTIGFPKLKKLTFRCCPKWKEWEDITAEEEESAAVSLMPCLTELSIQFCKGLSGLPRRLLRKAPLLDVLELQQRQGDKDLSDWKVYIAKSTPSA